MNFPHSALSAPALTAKDRRDLAEGLEAGVDFVGLSFVRSARNVEALRRLLGTAPGKSRPWIVAKIERAEALADLDAIASAADALMVARGDLGVEIGLAAVPAAQRRILEAGRRLSKPVIVATQMLESMIESPVPTRAEVSDVAFAVLGGADAVMLSGETAVGRFPREAVRAMAEIAVAAEVPGPGAPPPVATRPDGAVRCAADAVAHAAALAAHEAGAKAIVVYTESGRTARLVSKLGLPVPIVALSPSVLALRRMTLLREVVPFRMPRARSVEEMIRAGDRFLRKLALAPGRHVVEVSAAGRRQPRAPRTPSGSGLWADLDQRSSSSAAGCCGRRGSGVGRRPAVIRRSSPSISSGSKGTPSHPRIVGARSTVRAAGRRPGSTPGPAKTSGTTISRRASPPCPAAFPDLKPTPSAGDR